jgi:hypothetical protein
MLERNKSGQRRGKAWEKGRGKMGRARRREEGLGASKTREKPRARGTVVYFANGFL